jgi:hypothetical protein
VIRRFASASGGRSGGPPLETTPGLHRVVWDLRYTPPPFPPPVTGTGSAASDPAVAGRGFFVLPGSYQVRLTVGPRVLRQAVVVRMDPRVRASAADLTLQLKLSRGLDEALRQIGPVRMDVARREASATGDAATRVRAAVASLDAAWRELAQHLETIQQADVRPTPAIEAAIIDAIGRAAAVVAATRDGGS